MYLRADAPDKDVARCEIVGVVVICKRSSLAVSLSRRGDIPVESNKWFGGKELKVKVSSNCYQKLLPHPRAHAPYACAAQSGKFHDSVEDGRMRAH